MKTKIIMFAFVMMLMIGIVGAAEFDNIKVYDTTTKTITFKNTVLGVPTSDIANATLITPHNNYVLEGEDRLVAEIYINLFDKDYKGAFKNMKFLDLKKNNKSLSRNFEYKAKVVDYYNVDVYDWVCSPTGDYYNNGTEINNCAYEVIRTDEKEVVTWNKLTPSDLKKGTTNIGIFADVHKGDVVEWGMEMFGVDVIDVWATWTESFNEGLVSYWKFDNSTGNATNTYDSLGLNNGTVTGADYGQECKIDQCYYFDGTTADDRINVGQHSSLLVQYNYTLNFWYKFDTGFSNGATAFSRWTGSNRDIQIWLGAGDSNPGTKHEYFVDGMGEKLVSDGVATGSTWYMITAMGNETGFRLYVNGNLENQKTWTGGTGTTATDNIFGLRGVSQLDLNFKGWIDEAGFWNRSLTDTEITNLYNSGDGITYTGAGDDTPPYFTTIPSTGTPGYTDSFGVLFEADDAGSSIDTFVVNDTTYYNINSSGWFYNNTPYVPLGTYNLNVTVNDTQGNSNSTLYQVVVGQGDPTTLMSITGTTTITYPTTSSLSGSETNYGDGGCTYSLTPNNGIYGVAGTTFNYSTAGCDNYTFGSITQALTVNQNTTLALGITAVSPTTNRITTDVSGLYCPSELTCTLSPSNAVYPIGNVTFNYSTAGNENYTFSSATTTVIITGYVVGRNISWWWDWPNSFDGGKNVSDVSTFVEYVSYAGGGYFPYLILTLSFIIPFFGLKRFSNEKAFVGAIFVSFLVNTILMSMELIPWSIVIVHGIILVAGVILVRGESQRGL